MLCLLGVFFFQAEDGIRDLVRSRGLGDVYKRQVESDGAELETVLAVPPDATRAAAVVPQHPPADETSIIHIRRCRQGI